MNINILLFNDKDEVVSIDVPENNYKNNDILTIKNNNKNYKVVNIEKYQRLGYSQRVTMEIKKFN